MKKDMLTISFETSIGTLLDVTIRELDPHFIGRRSPYNYPSLAHEEHIKFESIEKAIIREEILNSIAEQMKQKDNFVIHGPLSYPIFTIRNPSITPYQNNRYVLQVENMNGISADTDLRDYYSHEERVLKFFIPKEDRTVWSDTFGFNPTLNDVGQNYQLLGLGKVRIKLGYRERAGKTTSILVAEFDLCA